MSQEDVTAMRGAYEAFNRGDIPAVLAVFDPAIEWHEPEGTPAAGVHQGADSVGRDVFGTVPQNFDEFSAEPEHFIDASERLVVTGVFRGRSKRGKNLEARFAHVWEMRGGRPVRFDNYVDSDAWREGWS